MAPSSTFLRRLFTSASTYRECRNCGTVLDQHTDDCPTCGATDIATYELP